MIEFLTTILLGTFGLWIYFRYIWPVAILNELHKPKAIAPPEEKKQTPKPVAFVRNEEIVITKGAKVKIEGELDEWEIFKLDGAGGCQLIGVGSVMRKAKTKDLIIA